MLLFFPMSVLFLTPFLMQTAAKKRKSKTRATTDTMATNQTS